MRLIKSTAVLPLLLLAGCQEVKPQAQNKYQHDIYVIPSGIFPWSEEPFCAIPPISFGHIVGRYVVYDGGDGSKEPRDK